MKTLSLSEARIKLGSIVDAVEATDQQVVITRNGRPAAVLISPDEFDSWNETVAVHSSGDLTAEIKRGLAALKLGKARLYTLAELLN